MAKQGAASMLAMAVVLGAFAAIPTGNTVKNISAVV